MRKLLLLAIRGYWRMVPPPRRRRCLFAKSCSQHVFDRSAAAGTVAGLTALRERFRACRPGYVLLGTEDEDGRALLRLADDSVVRLDDMSAAVRAQLDRK